MLIKIETDNYFITQRIREIDPNYFLVYNTKNSKFEVHNKRQADNTFCVCLPFICLDERTIDFVERTRIENFDRIMKEIDRENARLENENNNQKLDFLKEVIRC